MSDEEHPLEQAGSPAPHPRGGLPSRATHVPCASHKAQRRNHPLPLLRGCTAGQAVLASKGRAGFISQPLQVGHGEDECFSSGPYSPRRCRRRTCACGGGAGGSWRSCSWGPPRAWLSRLGTPAAGRDKEEPRLVGTDPSASVSPPGEGLHEQWSSLSHRGYTKEGGPPTMPPKQIPWGTEPLASDPGCF